MDPSSIHPNSSAAFDVTLRDGTVERVSGADAYVPELSMPTLFRPDRRPTVHFWSVRMASFRTDEILAIRRLEGAASAAGHPVAAGTAAHGDAVLRVV